MAGDSYILNDSNTPVECRDAVEWSTWMRKNVDRCRVAHTQIAPGLRVSTVFLGVDYNFDCPGASPVVFETMVFRDGDPTECARCSSWERALDNHARMVADARKGGGT